MSLRSLVFSSDLERSRPLIRALQELEHEVEHCREIFGAIERLTSRSFHVVVVDWDEGPEACFLLKTARELRLNKSAFALAVASETTRVVARETGADLFLTKPLDVDRIKYALLTCDHYLACLRIWLARNSAGAVEELAVAGAPQYPPPPETVQPEAPSPWNRPSPDSPSPAPTRRVPARSGPVSLTFATLDRKFFRAFNRGKQPLDARRVGSSSRARRNRSLWATLVVAFFSLGYASSQPVQLQNSFLTVKSSCQEALQAGKEWLHDYEAGSPPRSVAEADAPFDLPVGLKPGRVLTVHPAPASARASATASAALPAIPAPGAGSASPVARIPQSLQLPLLGPESGAGLHTSLGPSVLGQVQPVSLPEDSAMQLLLEKVQPSYPDLALRAGLQGSVVLQAWIRADGTIRGLKLVRGSFLLGQAAFNAVKQWRYQPLLRNGEAVEAQTYVTIDFRLPQQSLLTPVSR